MHSSLGSAGRSWPAVYFAVAALLVPMTSRAQNPNCADVDLPNKIYGVGGSAARPLIAAFGRALAALPGSERISVVWHDPGACHAMNVLVGQDDGSGERTPQHIAGTGARYWLPDGTEQRCDFAADTVLADFGYMAALPADCQGYEDVDLAALELGSFIGPVSGWSIITHPDSSQSAISAEALYLAYAFGDESQAAPWTHTAYLYARNHTSAALLAWVAATGLPSTSFLGEDVGDNITMVSRVASAAEPSAALGFVSSEVADANRATVKTLAFQAKDQICGFLPDSTSTSFDKKNIRDGHYWNWASHIFYAPVNGAGVPTNASVAHFFDAITGRAAPTAEVPNLDIIIGEGTIPECAMRVSRAGSYTALASFAPDEPCGCYYDYVADGASSCTECETTDDCAGEQVCRHGFCEEW